MQETTDRRRWMLGILQSILAVEAGAVLSPGQEHVHSTEPLASPEWKPQFFREDQNRLLIALGERVVPGSAKANCNRFIDLVLTIESEQAKKELTSALGVFDDEARRRYGRSYTELSGNAQDTILTDASSRGEAHFKLVKEWITDAYWSSQDGLRELGWTGRIAWESYPGCGSSA